MTKLNKLLRAGALALTGWAALLGTSAPAQAQESLFIGQMTYWAGNYAPRSWAFCDGQLMAISSNEALYSVIGTTYGGDGRATFGLPDMRGRASIHPGSGPGLTPRSLGQKLGSETNIYTLAQLAAHSHIGVLKATSAASNTPTATGAALALGGSYAGRPALDQTMVAASVETANTGGNQPVNNMQPSLTVSCIISLFGIYPSRN